MQHQVRGLSGKGGVKWWLREEGGGVDGGSEGRGAY
jgi:hypothetical protein